jgi:hypothetical protein
MNTFQIGDIVEYTGQNRRNNTPRFMGRTGVVTLVEPSYIQGDENVSVTWVPYADVSRRSGYSARVLRSNLTLRLRGAEGVTDE